MDDPRWQRLQAFEFDEPDAAYPFSARLARENGWTRRYAGRVLEEYKRFVYLCCVADHIACPSEAVDQAWHLHLTYTRSYWHKLCNDVLGRPLHHGPTRGGEAEHVKHVTLYEQTLASYRRVFGCEPPRDLWPPAEERFGIDTQVRRVNVARCWVIPKPRWPRWLVERRRAMGTALAALVPVTLASLNPFDLMGPEFLNLYVGIYLLGALMAVALRYVLRIEEQSPTQRELDPYEFACLRENERLAINVAIARLVQRDLLQIEPQIKKFLGLSTGKEYPIAAVGQPDEQMTPLELAVWKAARGGATFGDIQAGAAPAAQQITEKLAEEGLLLTPEGAARVRWWPAGIMLLVLVFGLIKVGVGMSRGQPVLYLLGLSGITLVTLIVFARKPWRTLAGDAWRKQYQERYKWLLSPYRSAPEGVDLMWAVALGGAAVLATGPLQDLHAAWTSHYRQSGGSFTSSGCGGAGWGGGGCGGGDGGGGGCGGCGGCGGD